MKQWNQIFIVAVSMLKHKLLKLIVNQPLSLFCQSDTAQYLLILALDHRPINHLRFFSCYRTYGFCALSVAFIGFRRATNVIKIYTARV